MVRIPTLLLLPFTEGEHLKSVFLFPQPVSVLNISSLLLAAVLCFISC